MSAEHVRMLADQEGELPPITVHRSTMRVIDGAHRVLAAKLRGESDIAVRFFEGDAGAAFVLAVRRNVSHGLPLTLAERTAAAARIVQTHPEWSDRTIASVAAISPKLVVSVRLRAGAAGSPSARVGRDGRVRPVDVTPGRRRAAELMRESPAMPLREVCRLAGISLGTASDVRQRIGRGEDPVPPSRRPDATVAASPPRPTAPKRGLEPDVILEQLRRDPSLRLSEIGRLLLRLLNMNAVAPSQWETFADSVPSYRRDVVVHLAGQWALQWQEFAALLEQRQLLEP
ncbi:MULTISPECIES: ParB/RepB/Spo0J family partition protein [unclassified Streptomyces]|uniref:ParB/RepB/Spo0J family partition protein n=1 Tax=unclassified Streptomyces TaxID=2593676 RepID=UPI0033B4F0CA